MSFLSYSKNFQGLADVFIREPKRYLPLAQLVATVMNGESDFTPAERELIALHVSGINNCPYCIGSHSAILKSQGTDAETIAGAAENPSTVSDPRIGAVLEFAHKLTVTPSAVNQADVDKVRAAGWSDQAVEDVVGVVSLFGLLNRLANGMDVEGTAESYAQTGAMIAEHGYGPLVQMVGEKADAA